MKRSIFLLLDHYPQLTSSHGEHYAFLLEHARSADALGFEALWLAEHHFQDLGTIPNPAVPLAAIAGQTRRLRIGPAVSVLPYRHPVLIAEDYAMVDILSNGRLNMGVGCGSQPVEFTGLDASFDNR
jgi:alkanesulfonate monooxygenase SsuD/methylene tetrahydromethanopterin reductase-like flavin-dependent oxidoreductase (luciferase family)